VAQKKKLKSEPDPRAQVALMLCESLLHSLVEDGVITNEQALNVIDTVVDLAHEVTTLGSARSNSQAPSASIIIEAIRRSFDAKRS
jgi:hypothetical protein